MSGKKFLSIPSSTSGSLDQALRATLEPIRDMVQRRFQGSVKSERAVTREDLVALGLVTQREIEQLKD